MQHSFFLFLTLLLKILHLYILIRRVIFLFFYENVHLLDFYTANASRRSRNNSRNIIRKSEKLSFQSPISQSVARVTILAWSTIQMLNQAGSTKAKIKNCKNHESRWSSSYFLFIIIKINPRITMYYFSKILIWSAARSTVITILETNLQRFISCCVHLFQVPAITFYFQIFQ